MISRKTYELGKEIPDPASPATIVLLLPPSGKHHLSSVKEIDLNPSLDI
jgi:hypothetical protein